MKLVIFGLTLSSSWGNGHATLWRGLCRALAGRGHRVVFFEQDTPYYARHRDQTQFKGTDWVLYQDWNQIRPRACQAVAQADGVIITSYCADALAATELARASTVRRKVFYDLDTPVTLSRLRNGQSVEYIGARGLRDFDLVLSYTGGEALKELERSLGARRVAPLYGSVDPQNHHPVPTSPRYACDLSYLGTYAPDRQAALERLFIQPARQQPSRKFVLGGSLYPEESPWAPNIYFVHHVAPSEHAAFYSSSRLTLNITRAAMAQYGYCPSGRLFEAAACGTPILSDTWPGLEEFFTPGEEILTAQTASEVVSALELSPEALLRIGRAARDQVLAAHTAEHRAAELEELLGASDLKRQPSSVCGA